MAHWESTLTHDALPRRRTLWRRLAFIAALVSLVITLVSTDPHSPIFPFSPERASADIAGGIFAGGNHSCAITTATTAKCWGDNTWGQVGDGTTTDRPMPVTVPGLTGVSSLALGIEHTCALLTTGNVWCWGDNLSGQLGDGTTTASLIPVAVCAVGASAPCSGGSQLTGVVALRASGRHTCAETSVGELRCWGDNYDGQLGDGTFVNRASPVVVCASGAGSGCPAFTGFSVAPGAFGSEGFTCAAHSTNGSPSVWCWGDNSVGQLGDGMTGGSRPLPAPVCSSGTGSGCLTTASALVRAGSAHACARTTSFGVECWGYNAFGQLGDGTTTNRANPVAVCDFGDDGGGGCGGSLSNGNFLALGEHQSCISVGGNYSVVCWGEDFFGQLGNGAPLSDSSIPLHVCAPAPVACGASLTNASQIAGGHGHACARLLDGRIACWGYNAEGGQLGDGSLNDSPVPVYVIGFGGNTPDSDGDGLPDYWELTGDLDYDGTMDLDLPAMGADPQVKDIFVEVDWMDCAVAGSDCPASSHNDKPDARALQLIMMTFWCAPERIHLHVDAGSASIMNPIPFDANVDPCHYGLPDDPAAPMPFTGPTWGSLSRGEAYPHVDVGMSDVGATFDATRVPVFHHALFVHDLNFFVEGGHGGGYSPSIPGALFWVGLGWQTYPLPRSNTQRYQAEAGTFIHELGHNLGLFHGGGADINYKPNYLSIMNYFFPTGPIINGTVGVRFDYSRSMLDPLDEEHLNEVNGLEPDSAVASPIYGTLWICASGGVDVNGVHFGGAAYGVGSLDFDCSGSEDGAGPGTCVDGLNNDPSQDPPGLDLRDQTDPDCASALSTDTHADVNGHDGETQLDGYEDWSHLVLNGGPIGNPIGMVVANSSSGQLHADVMDGVEALTDSDGDGLLDTAEAFVGSDPNNTDSDGDGLSDGREVGVIGTGPTNPDTDDDGYNDGAEVQMARNPNAYCAIMRADVDGDGTVSIVDLSLVAGEFLQSVPPADARYDQGPPPFDNQITIIDLSNMAGEFLNSVLSCP
jgi:alpha-tubulin suppressor-like RCC1 family protein